MLLRDSFIFTILLTTVHLLFNRGKPKKGRGAREGKRIKHNDQDFDYDDDNEM